MAYQDSATDIPYEGKRLMSFFFLFNQTCIDMIATTS